MLCNDFVAHLARKGVLRDPHLVEGGLNARHGDGLDELDWLGLTKLAPSAFADELADFCGCNRVQRSELVASQFVIQTDCTLVGGDSGGPPTRWRWPGSAAVP
jgi:general secretion pathway protein E